MRTNRRKEEIAASLKLLASTYAQAVRQLEETLAILSRELDLRESSWLHHPLALEPIDVSPGNPMRPVADRRTLSAVFNGRSCFLGNTLLFRFFETIAHRPNRYFSYSELLDEVWGGPRSDSTIRNVAKRLRDKLMAGGLKDLAHAINGNTSGYYILLLNTDK